MGGSSVFLNVPLSRWLSVKLWGKCTAFVNSRMVSSHNRQQGLQSSSGLCAVLMASNLDVILVQTGLGQTLYSFHVFTQVVLQKFAEGGDALLSDWLCACSRHFDGVWRSADEVRRTGNGRPRAFVAINGHGKRILYTAWLQVDAWRLPM